MMSDNSLVIGDPVIPANMKRPPRPASPEQPAFPDLLPYQFWAMVEISGKREAVETFAESLPGEQRIIARAKLQHTLSFRRDNPLVEAARQGIGLSKEELDALWLQAAGI